MRARVTPLTPQQVNALLGVQADAPDVLPCAYEKWLASGLPSTMLHVFTTQPQNVLPFSWWRE